MIRADEIEAVEALRLAWREYQRAPLGRLNATAEALRDAA
jgi:hypothetical protein